MPSRTSSNVRRRKQTQQRTAAGVCSGRHFIERILQEIAGDKAAAAYPSALEGL
jgi:hypothetical protein